MAVEELYLMQYMHTWVMQELRLLKGDGQLHFFFLGGGVSTKKIWSKSLTQGKILCTTNHQKKFMQIFMFFDQF